MKSERDRERVRGPRGFAGLREEAKKTISGFINEIEKRPKKN